MKRLRLVATRLWLIPVAVVAWELLTRGAHDPFYPPPSTILSGMHALWFSGPVSHLWLTQDAISNVLPSLGRLFGGWVAAVLLGVAAGVAIGRVTLLADFFEPVVHFGRAVPPPMLLPVFLVLFKIGTEMEVATIIFGSIWPVLVNTIDGTRYTSRLYLDTAQVFGITRTQRLLRVILPAAAPRISAGLRISLSVALIMMVISEITGGATNGIGYELQTASQSFDMTTMWGGILLLGILGVVLNVTFLLVERRVLAWHRGSQQIP